MDQAEKLRNLVAKHDIHRPGLSTAMRVIAITSGKGGVGKTNLAINLGIYLSRANKRVVVVDADFGLANVEVLLGVSPRYSFKDVLSSEVSIVDALTTGPEGVRFLSGGSGLTQLADITESQMAILISGFTQLDSLADVLIIDTGAGMSKNVTNFLKAAHETIVVTTSDPTSVTDAYAIIKIMTENSTNLPRFRIVVNRVETQKEGTEVFSRLYRVCNRFLDVKPVNLGIIPYDKHLIRAVKSQEPVSLMYPYSESSRSIEMISKRLLHETGPESTGIKQFIERLIGIKK